jgi:hypothetical protein
MHDAWEQMAWHELWHDPAYRLHMVERSFAKECDPGAYMCTGSCTCHDDSGSCDTCCNTGEFSSSACEICGNPLGGRREALVLIHPRNENLYYEACIDCVYFSEYGTLDDQTMLEIEHLYGGDQ